MIWAQWKTQPAWLLSWQRTRVSIRPNSINWLIRTIMTGLHSFQQRKKVIGFKTEAYTMTVWFGCEVLQTNLNQIKLSTCIRFYVILFYFIFVMLSLDNNYLRMFNLKFDWTLKLLVFELWLYYSLNFEVWWHV